MAYNPAVLYKLTSDYLSAQPRLPLTELASRLGVCRQTLERALRGATGKSFRRLRAETLASKACDLLASSNHQVKEIAYSLGWKSPQAFARFLKSERGCSPTQLQKDPRPSRAA